MNMGTDRGYTPYSTQDVQRTVKNQYEIPLLAAVIARQRSRNAAIQKSWSSTPLTDALVALTHINDEV